MPAHESFNLALKYQLKSNEQIDRFTKLWKFSKPTKRCRRQCTKPGEARCKLHCVSLAAQQGIFFYHKLESRALKMLTIRPQTDAPHFFSHPKVERLSGI
jgi:hypothetical protein